MRCALRAAAFSSSWSTFLRDSSALRSEPAWRAPRLLSGRFPAGAEVGLNPPPRLGGRPPPSSPSLRSATARSNPERWPRGAMPSSTWAGYGCNNLRMICWLSYRRLSGGPPPLVPASLTEVSTSLEQSLTTSPRSCREVQYFLTVLLNHHLPDLQACSQQPPSPTFSCWSVRPKSSAPSTQWWRKAFLYCPRPAG